jgi:sRNA-binding regulator protein Hfq
MSANENFYFSTWREQEDVLEFSMSDGNTIVGKIEASDSEIIVVSGTHGHRVIVYKHHLVSIVSIQKIER